MIIFQTWLLTFASEKLMMRLRVMAFTNILRQAVGWFDNNDSSPGCLTTKLARDAPVVKAVSACFKHFLIFNFKNILSNRLAECVSGK